jgi:hypothetical protein
MLYRIAVHRLTDVTRVLRLHLFTGVDVSLILDLSTLKKVCCTCETPFHSRVDCGMLRLGRGYCRYR